MSTIQIALASDEKFAQHLAVTLASILLHAAPDDRLAFCVIDGGITPESKEKLEELRSIKDFDLTFLTPDWSLLEGCPEVLHLTKNTYLRLLIPKLLPEIPKILYLDCDIVVTTSLHDLWNIDMEGKSIACAMDNPEQFWRTLAPETDGVKKRLNIKNTPFNAGVLLMDLEKVRRQESFDKTIRWLETHPKLLHAGDQDGLNVIFNDDYKLLPQCWNIQIFQGMNQYYDLTRLVRSFYRKDENGREAGGIIHFITAIKPWHPEFSDPVGDLYFSHLVRTAWRDWKVKRTLIQKILYPVRRTWLFRQFRLLIFRHTLTRNLTLLFFRTFFPQKK